MRRLMAMAFDCPICRKRVQTYGHVGYCKKKKLDKENREKAAADRFDHDDPLNYVQD